MATRQRTPKEIEDEILSKLDIAREFENLGLKLATDKPTSKGWISCHAYGREDATPSAAINLYTGCFKDHGGTHTTCGLFDFAVMTGRFTDWKEARHHFAVMAGLEKTLPRKDTTEERRPEDRIEIQPLWNPFMVRGLIAAYRGMTNESLMRADAKLCMWPKGRRIQEHCVALPIYGLQLTDNKPVGFIVMATNGGKLRPNAKSEEKKRLVIGETGLINRRGVSMIADRRAELVLKAEGVTDQQAIQAELCKPENVDLLDRIAVVSNACGANETTLPREIAPVFSGIPTVILHDADEPGQDGAKLWKQEIGKFAPCVNLQLPYEIEKNHGKDSRDWINEGGTIRGLLEMVRVQFPGFLAAFDGVAAKPSGSQADPDSHAPFDGGHSRNGNGGNGVHSGNGNGSVLKAGPQNGRIGDAGEVHAGVPAGNGVAETEPVITIYQGILKRIGMIALGMPEGTNNVTGFCTRNGRTFVLDRIGKLGIEDLGLHLGDEITSQINLTEENDPTKLSLSAIRLAIAAEGGRNRLTGRGYLGVGIWEIGGRLIVVNAGEATIVNCEITRTKIPTQDGKIFDFGDSTKWFDHDWFVEEFERSANREYSMGIFNEAIEIFSRWDNWAHSRNPELIAALVCCTWIQTIWDYRPQACVVGGSNSGKTSLFTAIKGMFCRGRMTVGGADPTAAWIRQSLGNTAKAIMGDEFENPHRRKECLDMFRAASRGETVGRGTSGQKGISYTLRHLPWHGAITADFRSAADRNRYLLLELNPVQKGRGSTLQMPDPVEAEQLGLKLMVIAVRHWQRARSIAAAVKKVPFDGVDRRVVESFSVPCAMISAILGLSEPESVELLRDILSERNFEEQSESDEQSLLREIFESQILLTGSNKSTVSMVLKGVHGSSHDDALVRCGIRKILKDKVEYLFFCESSICANLFTDQSKKAIGVCQILVRIPGAVRDRQRMGSHNPRGVSVPMATIHEMLGIIEGEDDSFDEIGKGDRAEITGLAF